MDHTRSPYLVFCLVACVIVPLLVLAGWQFGVEAFRSVVPGLTAMNPLTALAFLLCAFALACVSRGQTVWARVLAVAVAVAGAAPLVAGALGPGWRPDEVLFAGALAQYDPPNRMAPNTSVSFAAVGAALFLTTHARDWSAIPSQILSALAALLGLLTVVGYLINEIGTAQVLDFIPMAPHTGALFFVLGTCVMLMRRDEGVLGALTGDSEGARLARRLLLYSAVVVIALNLLRLWGEQAGFYNRPVSILIFSFVAIAGLAVVIGLATREYQRSQAARREAEAVAGRQGQFVAHLIDSIPGLVYAKNREGRFVFANEAVAKALGTTREDVVGKTTLDFIQDSPEVQAFLESDRRVMETGEAETFEAPYPRQDGSTGWLLTSKQRIESPFADQTVTLGISTDITELQEAKQQAQWANEAKSEFISRMSHELRTPLNAVMGFAQLIQLYGTDDKTKDACEQILKAGRHLLQLINEVLDLARVEAGRLAVSIEPVVVQEALEMALGIGRPIADERSVTIRTEGLLCDRATVRADRQRLSQIMINLLSNAVKYNRRGGEVTVRCEEAGGAVAISVSDTGMGIAEEDRHRLFEPFSRLRDGEVEGTGLGLSLSLRLAAAMDGTLELVESGTDGSTFRVTLPRTEEAPERAVAEPRAEYAAHGPRSEKSTLLYIEDNLANLRLIEHVLAEWGPVEILSAMQGSIGLEIARTRRPDLVLLDLHLPDMSGLDVLREVRLDSRTAAIPVVALSADATKSQIRRCMALGADEYLTKPIDVQEVMRLLSEWQAKKWRRGEE